MSAPEFSFSDIPKDDKATSKGGSSAPRQRAVKKVNLLTPQEINKQWKEGLETLGALYMIRCAQCGNHIIDNAQAHANAVSKLAKDNARFRETISRMLQGSAYAGLFLATGQLIVPVFAHHGLNVIPKMKHEEHEEHAKKGRGKVVPMRKPADSPSDPGAEEQPSHHIYQPSAADPNICIVCTQPRNTHPELVAQP